VKDFNIGEYTFEALCLKNVGPKIETLAYVVGLVDSEQHVAGIPDTARHKILYPLSECEVHVARAKDILKMQAQFLPSNYLPQTPVMFVRRWSPITSMLNKGFEPITLTRKAENAPFAVATGIWKAGIAPGAKKVPDCTTDEELFWAIMSEVFEKARNQVSCVNIIAEVGWSYKKQVGRLQTMNDKEVAKSGRVIWKSTVDG
jgi:hypothetical protein